MLPAGPSNKRRPCEIDRTYLQNLEKETVIDVACCKLRDLWQGPCSEGSQGIMYMSLRKLHQGRAYPLPFTATIQPFVIDKGLYLPC